MKTNQQIERAIQIVATATATAEERAAIRAAFALLFWNEPGFKPSEFKAACDAAAARAA